MELGTNIKKVVTRVYWVLIKMKGARKMQKMKLSDIIIKEDFKNSPPKFQRIEECRQKWKSFGEQDRLIIVNHDNVLVDGYVMYLVLLENGIEEAEIRIGECAKRKGLRKSKEDMRDYRNERTCYVYGKHPSNNAREYIWRIPPKWTQFADNVQRGDLILCEAKSSYAPVIVTRIEVCDTCPVTYEVRKVWSKMIRRNGCVVK